MRPRRLSGDQTTTLALIALTVLTVAETALGAASEPRLYLAVVFVTVAPGWAIVSYLRIDSQSLRWTAAVAMGVSVTIIAAQIMTTTGWWHPTAMLLILAAATLAALSHHLVRDRPGAAGASR
jgi:uncharacterized membrane protein